MNSTLRNILISISVAIVIAGAGTIIALIASEYGNRFIEWIDR